MGDRQEFNFPDVTGSQSDKFDADLDVEGGNLTPLDFDEPSPKPTKKQEKVVEEEDDDDDDFEIEVVDDTPEEDRGRKKSEEPPREVTDEELEQYSESVQKRIRHLHKGYHDERREKEAAVRERDELVKLVQSLKQNSSKLQESETRSRKTAIEQALVIAEDRYNAAKAQYREAYESGDTDKVIEAQELMSKAALAKDKVQTIAKRALQAPQNTLQETSTPIAPPAPEAPKPRKPDEKAEAWRDSNPWFGEDRKMTAYALGVHDDLVSQGYNPKSDEYYAAIDRELRTTFPAKFNQPKGKSAGNVVAPASRTRAPKKVTLTASQQRLIKRLGITPKEYVKQMQLLQKQGD